MSAEQIVAIAGQPNVGKSTIFNILTGLRQSVGNWAGKTVEKLTGYAHEDDGSYEVVDLPGSYALGANSAEEQIAHDFLLHEQPNLTIIVVSAASLERTLYYALDIMLLSKPCIIVLNMIDVAQSNGVNINAKELSERLGVDVIPMIGSKGTGAIALRKAIQKCLKNPSVATHTLPTVLSYLEKDTLELHAAWTKLLQDNEYSKEKALWLAWRALEQDTDSLQIIAEISKKTATEFIQPTRQMHDSIQQAKFIWAESMTKRDSLVDMQRTSKTVAWDRWLLHPIIGPICMIGIFIIALAIGFTAVFPFAMWVVGHMFAFEAQLLSIIPSDFDMLLALCKGSIRGVLSVITMLPFLLIFYTTFSILENVGYMSRVAFLMNGMMNRLCLNGNAFVPLLFALPCNFLGVMACRTMETAAQRRLLYLLIPFVPCTVKIMVLSTIAAWFFTPTYAAITVVALMIMNLMALFICCILFKKFIPDMQHDYSSLIMELPHYHRPNFKTILHSVLTHIKAFLKKAMTFIFAFCILIWFVSYYPGGNVETSWLAQLGRSLEWLGSLMGADWKLLMALFTSAASKEATLATMGVLYNVPISELPAILKSTVSPQGALAFMAALSLFMPCAATYGVIYKESQSLKLVLFIMFYTIFLPLVVAVGVYQVANLFS